MQHYCGTFTQIWQQCQLQTLASLVLLYPPPSFLARQLQHCNHFSWVYRRRCIPCMSKGQGQYAICCWWWVPPIQGPLQQLLGLLLKPSKPF